MRLSLRHFPNTIAAGLVRAADWIFHESRLVPAGLVFMALLAPFALLYNLDQAPRTWHDEGGALSLARTLAEEGVYAVRSDGAYQTFGAVQSVGPTVILPVALSFKLFGVGLVQGRVVMALFSLFTLVVFYRLARALFEPSTAVLALLFFLVAAGARFLYFGRQVSGEVPALGFFLAGVLFWFRGVRSRRLPALVAGGLLAGAAMVTKTTYIPLTFAVLGFVVLADLVYYRDRMALPTVLTGVVAFVCVAAWQGWQYFYYGPAVFLENYQKMQALGGAISGFDPGAIKQTVRYFLGPDLDHYFFWWGFPALLYSLLTGLTRRPEHAFRLGLLGFVVLGLGYYLLTVPWLHYLFAPVSVSAMFVAKLWRDLLVQAGPTRGQTSPIPGVALRVSLAIVVLLTLAFHLQNTLEFDVLARDDTPRQAAAFLNANVPEDALVETWERELNILTRHRYHFPDQGYLVQAHAALYRDGPLTFRLGETYLNEIRPAYVVVGFYARLTGIYDLAYLEQHGELVETIGSGEKSYQVYRLAP